MPIVDLCTARHATAYGRWQALNAPLGVTAFGINAIVCDPGEEIDTHHDETDSGQHEVYIVVAGRIEFQLGDEVLRGRSRARSWRLQIRPLPAGPRGRARHAGRLRRRRAGRRRARLRRMDRPGRLVN